MPIIIVSRSLWDRFTLEVFHNAEFRKCLSCPLPWAINTRLLTNSRKPFSPSIRSGAWPTISLVIPVKVTISSGTWRFGLTKV
ncbi:hypothetical protein D3C81_2041390 [compost metagenome]